MTAYNHPQKNSKNLRYFFSYNQIYEGYLTSITSSSFQNQTTNSLEEERENTREIDYLTIENFTERAKGIFELTFSYVPR